MAIQDYDIQIEYCSGKNNVVAGALSRLLGQKNGQNMSYKDSKTVLYALAKRPSLSSRNLLQNFAKKQKLDPVLQLKRKDVGEKKTVKYEMHEDLLYFINGENKYLCLSKSIIYDTIHECYEM